MDSLWISCLTESEFDGYNNSQVTIFNGECHYHDIVVQYPTEEVKEMMSLGETNSEKEPDSLIS
jgi:hypothetical protein